MQPPMPTPAPTPRLSSSASPPRRTPRRPSRPLSPRGKGPTDTISPSPELRSLLNHLATERGLANNSLHAYRRDLEDLDRHLSAIGKSLITATAADFRGYLQHQSQIGQSTKTVARRLAAIRVFLRFLALEGFDTTAILSQLERPKPERSLPKILSRAQVAALISTPDPGSFMFSRDVAILELLYASGLRAVSCATLSFVTLICRLGASACLAKE